MIQIIPSTQNERVLIRINRSVEDVHVGARHALRQIGRLNVRHTKELIKNPPKTGRWYGAHRASKGFEAPANRTGALMASVRYALRGSFEMEFGDGEEVKYGKWLEHGTRKMHKRPHIERTVRERGTQNAMILSRNIDHQLSS